MKVLYCASNTPPSQSSIIVYNMEINMKKSLQYIAIFGLALALPLGQAKAEVAIPVVKTSDKVVISTDKTTDGTDSLEQPALKDQPLSVRKDKVETDFKTLIIQLGLFNSRTQSALDRLTTKNIDIGASQDELTLAGTSLSDAKASLGVFSKVAVPTISEGKQDKASADLKASAKKTEDSLREARLHLINALTILKDSLNSITQ